MNSSLSLEVQVKNFRVKIFTLIRIGEFVFVDGACRSNPESALTLETLIEA